MLLQLPPEVFLLVIKQLNNKDLKVLSCISKSAHDLIAEPLWRSITLETKPNFRPHELKTDNFPKSRLKYISGLRFDSDFYANAPAQCPSHHDSDDNGNASRHRAAISNSKISQFSRFGTEIQSFMSQLEQGQLRSFCWNLGTCIREATLGPNGILKSMQSSLKSLELGTSCSCTNASTNNIDLLPFRQLKSICWKGLHEVDVQNLSVPLENNAAHLERLELDLLEWCAYARTHGYREEDLHDKFGFAAKILSTERLPLTPYFSSLRELSLSEIRLGASIGSFINFATLEILTIRRCPDWSKFLKGITSNPSSVRLKTFEFTETECTPFTDQDMHNLDAFLGSFSGLRELFLSLQAPMDTLTFWDSLDTHCDTLTAFVHHQRICAEIPNHFWGPTATELDQPSLSLSTSQIRELEEDPSCSPLSQFNFEYLGLSCIPEILRPLLLPFTSKKSLKLLHIRQSAYDLEQFAPITTLQIRKYFDRYGTYMEDDLDSNQSYNLEVPSDEDDWESVDLDNALDAPLILRDQFYRFYQPKNHFEQCLSLWYKSLATGGSINVTENAGNPPVFTYLSSRINKNNLHQECHSNGYDKLFIPNSGVDVFATDDDDETALHIVTRRDDNHYTDNGHDTAPFGFMLTKELDMLKEDKRWSSAFHVASACGKVDILQILVRK